MKILQRTPTWYHGIVVPKRGRKKSTTPDVQQGIFPVAFVELKTAQTDEAVDADGATVDGASAAGGAEDWVADRRNSSTSSAHGPLSSPAAVPTAPSGSGDAGVVPVSRSSPPSLKSNADPLRRPSTLSSQASSSPGVAHTNSPSTVGSPGTDGVLSPNTSSANAAMYVKIDRCLKEWSVSLKRHLAAGNSRLYHEVKTQIAQLLEWRRQLLDAEFVRPVDPHTAIVRESVMRLVESATQIREGLLVPRTDTDEVVSDQNTGIVDLFELHQAAQSRLEAGVRIPMCFTEQLEMETTRGQQFGASAAAASAAAAAHDGLLASGGAEVQGSDRVHMLMEIGKGCIDDADESVLCRRL